MPPGTEDAESSPGSRKRQRGTTPFPYADLEDAVRIAKGVWSEAGAGTAQLDRVAVVTGHKNERSGTFRVRAAAARLFGLLDWKGMDVVLTDLGRRIVNPGTEQPARVDAFLKVDLFKRLFERYRSQQLPGSKALEREMVAEGIAPNQGENARRTFLAAAKQAGFFDTKPDVLISPRRGPRESEGAADVVDKARASVRRVYEGAPGRFSQNPLIEGLFRMLPVEGSFTPEQQERWLEAAKVNLALVYGSEQGDPPRHPEPGPPAEEN
ncbi:MAG: hypothetical protein ABR505_10455 [Actinomycetota bacterium]